MQLFTVVSYVSLEICTMLRSRWSLQRKTCNFNLNFNKILKILGMLKAPSNVIDVSIEKRNKFF